MSNEVAVQSPVDWAVAQCGMPTKEELYKAIKIQCFGAAADKTNESHMAIYLYNAKKHKLDPLAPGQMYAFPTKYGVIQIVIGPDGLFAILRNHPDVIYWTTEAIYDTARNLLSAVAKIYVRSSPEPFVFEAIYDEWKVDGSPNWMKRPIHFLKYRALKQCARYVIAGGLPLDEEEANMVEMQTANAYVVDNANASKTARLTAKMAAAPIVTNTLPPVEVQAEPVVSPVNIPKREELDLDQSQPKQEDDAKAKAKALSEAAKRKYPELFDSLSSLGKHGKKSLNEAWLNVTSQTDDVNECVHQMMQLVSEKALDFLAMACPPDVHKETIQRINASQDKSHTAVLEAIAGGW